MTLLIFWDNLLVAKFCAINVCSLKGLRDTTGKFINKSVNVNIIIIFFFQKNITFLSNFKFFINYLLTKILKTTYWNGGFVAGKFEMLYSASEMYIFINLFF